LLPSIDVITQEEVVGLWWEASILKQTQQIIVLTVDISTDFEWSFQLQQDGLREENLPRLQAQASDLILC
jgi:hypothetical protein